MSTSTGRSKKRCVALKGLILPDSLREEFRRPFGKIIVLDDVKAAKEKMVAVGDAASFCLIKHGFKPDVIVFDNMEKRKPVTNEVKQCLQNYAVKKFFVKNPARHVTAELWKTVKLSLQSNVPAAIEVEGEEDLTALPFFLESPVGTVVYYGLFDSGMVEVKIDKKLKDKCKELVKEMTEGL